MDLLGNFFACIKDANIQKTNSKDSLQMTLAHSRLLPEVTGQILWQLCKPPSTQLVPLPGRTASGHFIAQFQEARAKLGDCKWGKVTQSC